MNVTESLANVQSQPAGGAKAAAAATGGVFQSLLADGLAQNGAEQQAADQLLDLISQLNSDQIAQLLAMLGLNPQSSQLGVSVTAASEGSLSGKTQMADESMFLQNGPQQSVGLLIDAAQLLPAKTEAGKPNDGSPSQLLQNLSALLKQAGISAQDAVSQLQNTLKDGGDIAAAFRQLTEQVQQTIQKHKISGAHLAEGAFALVADSGGLRQMGSQIRPEMLNAVMGSGEAQTAISANADSTNDTTAAQTSTDSADTTDTAPNLTATAFSLAKNQQANEAQPAAAHVKMSSGQFQSDFPTMVVKQATLTERGGLSEMRITLMPEGMGEIQVRIQGEGGLVSLQIAADSQHARSLLDANLGMLKQHLEAQGMQLNRVEVVASNSSAGMNNMDQGMFDGRSRQQQDANQQQSSRQPSANSKYQFEEELMYQQTANMSAGQYDWIA